VAIIMPLSAALVLKVTFIKSLPTGRVRSVQVRLSLLRGRKGE
jgi:hypothetical protein